jgi:hypothetical protein
MISSKDNVNRRKSLGLLELHKSMGRRMVDPIPMVDPHGGSNPNPKSQMCLVLPSRPQKCSSSPSRTFALAY